MYDYYYTKSYIPLPANTPAQLSAEWFRLRKNPKYPATVTGSVPASWYFEASSEEGYGDCVDYLWGKKKKKFNENAIASMKRGRELEAVACARFYEWFRTNKKDVMIEESTFERSDKIPTLGASPDGIVYEKKHGWILAKKDTIFIFRHNEGTVELSSEQAEKAVAKAASLSGKQEEIPTQYISEGYTFEQQNKGWTMQHALSKVPAVCYIKSVIEIKCPKKMPSQPLLYYLPQIHLECFVTNTRSAYFVTYTADEEKTERLRVWKIKFNDCFWNRLLECIECMQSIQQDGTKGAPYSVFAPIFEEFKRTYLRKPKVWNDFIEAQFEPRKMSYEVEYNTYGVLELYKGT